MKTSYLPKLSGVYLIFNIKTGGYYVGSTTSVNGIRERLTKHRSDLRRNNHPNKHLQNSWNKHKEQNFICKVLELCLPEYCLERESYWFSLLKIKNSNFYNKRAFTDTNVGIKHNKKVRESFSKVKRNKKNNGENAIGYALQGKYFNPRLRRSSLSSSAISLGYYKTREEAEKVYQFCIQLTDCELTLWNNYRQKCRKLSRGVYFDNTKQRWKSKIQINKKGYDFGSFKTKEEAYEVYNFLYDKSSKFIETYLSNLRSKPLRFKKKSDVYKGVRWSGYKWEANISHKGKNIYIGVYETEKEAAIAYNNKAIELRGNNAILNNII